MHTPSTAFRHIPPNSARIGYATEDVLFISAQLSTDAVSAIERFRGSAKGPSLISNLASVNVKQIVYFTYHYDCGSNIASKHASKHETRPPWVKKKEKKKSSVSILTILALSVLVSNVEENVMPGVI